MISERDVQCIKLTAALATSIALGATATALAADIEVIYTKIPTHPSSIVPGALDLNGDPAETRFRAFEDLIGSPDGSQWLIKGRNQLGSDLETMLLLGSGTTGAVHAQEGQPIPDGEPGELFEFFGSGVGRFNDNGDFAYAARARNGDPSVKQKVISVIDGVSTIETHESDPYTGLQDLPPNPSGDELVGNSIGSIHLLNNGTIGAQDSTIQNIHSTRRPAVFYDNIAFQQSNVSTFVGIDGSTTETWLTLDSNAFYTTPNSSPLSLGEPGTWIAQGRRVGQSFGDAVLVINGAAALETGAEIGRTGVIVDDVFNTALQSNGDWYARGSTADGGDYAVRNGELIATTGDLVDPDGTETWTDSFIAFSGNQNGDWLLIGSTDNVDSASNEVIVVNGDIVVREGDPIDLDGNGKLDDDVFIGRGNDTLTAFSGNNAFLADDGYLYFFASLRDSQGNDLNSDPPFSTPLAFLRVQAIDSGEPCVGDLNNDNVVNVLDLLSLLSAWGDCPGCPEDLNGDDVVNVLDLLEQLGAWGECP